MSKPHGIIVFGANGSGKTTLGRELAHILNFKHMDIEDYYFEKSKIPYTVERSREDCLNLMLADIEKYRSFVITAVTGDFGDIIPQMYEFAVYISVPIEIRMKRIKQRAYELHGKRVCEGGDMYEQELKFFNYVASRPLSKIEQWAETLKCPIIHIDGTTDLLTNAAYIAERFYGMNEKSNLQYNTEFWQALDKLVAGSEIIIDRPKACITKQRIHEGHFDTEGE